MTPEAPDPSPSDSPMMLGYALAWSGGTIAYMPFLTLMLPLRLSALAGADDVRWLGLTATLGAICASLANIGWGWLSDRGGARLRWSALGLVMMGLALSLVALAATPAALLASVLVWQVALNLYLAPLGAFAADHVLEAQHGRLGGLLALAPGCAALALPVIVYASASFTMQLLLIYVLVCLLFVPLVITGGGRLRPLRPATGIATSDTRSLKLLWLARLCVQVSGTLMLSFVYYVLRDLAGGRLTAGRYAGLNAVVYVAAIPVAIVIGRRADRSGSRRAPLLGVIVLLASGLLLMAASRSWPAVVAGYAGAIIGSTVFLSLHSGFILRHLAPGSHRGRDLGVINLTNTLPSVVAPPLAVLLIEYAGYPALLAVLAATMAIPGWLVWQLRTD